MKTIIAASLLAAPLTAQAQTPAPSACLLAPEQLAQTFGVSFAAGKDEGNLGMLGLGCSYQSDAGYSVWLIAVRPADFGSTSGQMLKLTDPGQWEPIADGPDGALRQIQTPDVPPFPSIAYERQGLLVKLRIVGTSGGAQSIADMNAKLAHLPRLP